MKLLPTLSPRGYSHEKTYHGNANSIADFAKVSSSIIDIAESQRRLEEGIQEMLGAQNFVFDRVLCKLDEFVRHPSSELLSRKPGTLDRWSSGRGQERRKSLVQPAFQVRQSPGRRACPKASKGVSDDAKASELDVQDETVSLPEADSAEKRLSNLGFQPPHGSFYSGAGVNTELLSPVRGVSGDDADADSEESISSHVLALPVGWPSTIHGRLVGLDKVVSTQKTFSKASLGADLGYLSRRKSKSVHFDPIIADRKVEPWSIRPNSYCRFATDILCLAALFSDLVLTPFVLAWNVPLRGWLRWLSLLTGCIWIVDMIMNFFTGFYAHGDLVMQLSVIMRNNLWTNFPVDFTIVVVEMLLVLFNGPSPLRVIALLRFLRLVKLRRFYDRSLHSNTATLVVVWMSFFLFGIVWLLHLFACSWHALGTYGASDTGMSWIEDAPRDYRHTTSFLYEYSVALHWSLQQMCGAGALDVGPRNSAERFFAVACLLFGWLFGSFMVSSISTTMIEYQVKQRDWFEQLRTLQEYLNQHSVDPEVVSRVRKHVVAKMESSHVVTREEVSALSVLSTAVHAELICELHRPHLLRYPLFQIWEILESNSVNYLAVKHSTMISFTTGDLIITAGLEAHAALLLLSGQSEYSQESIWSMEKETKETRVTGSGQMVCEAALWSYWTCVGTLEASARGEALAIDVSGFASTVPYFPRIRSITWDYAKQFLTRLQAASPPHPWPTDLSVPFCDCSEIVFGMEVENRKIIAHAALGSTEEAGFSRLFRRSLSSKALSDLHREVELAECALVLNSAGEVERIVAVTVLNLHREDGRILVYIGKWSEDGELTPTCKLPGTKQKAGESMASAMDRLMDEDVIGWKDRVRFVRTEEVTEVKRSGRADGLMTKYLRCVHYARLTDSVTPPSGAIHTTALLGRSVYMFRHDSQLRLFTWLEPEEFEHYSSPDGQSAWSRHINSMKATSMRIHEEEFGRFAVRTRYPSGDSEASSRGFREEEVALMYRDYTAEEDVAPESCEPREMSRTELPFFRGSSVREVYMQIEAI